MYSTRNARYLRISSWTVLPLYLYLDERHVGWMNDETLKAVLADLRPKLLKKFHAEDPNMVKKSTVEVHRGDTYQFAFFFRKTDTRHVVLLKKREYVPVIRKGARGKPKVEVTSSTAGKRRRPAKSKAPAESGPAPKRPARSIRSGSRVNYSEDLLVSPDPSSPLLQLEESEPAGARTRLASTSDVSSGVNHNDNLLVSPEPSSPLLPIDQETETPPLAQVSEQPLFFASGNDDAPGSPLVQVKAEPLDPSEPPGLPVRSEAERAEMRAGAHESLGRTTMPTGFEDPSIDSGEREQQGSDEELVTFRPVEDEEEEGKDLKDDVKPSLRLSYKGFSIASRHLVLIIEPYPSTTPSTHRSSYARSTYSRSMSRATGVERDTPGSMTMGLLGRGDTPLVPNSRRGGTGSVFPTPGPGTSVAPGQTPIPNSRSGGATPFARPSVTPARSIRNASRTPLFRDMTPMSEFGDASRSGAGGLFADDGSSEEEEEAEWRKRVRGSSYAPWRGASVLDGAEQRAPTGPIPSQRRMVTDSDDSDDIDAEDLDDDDDAEEVAQARRLMALSQRLQSNTSGRAGAVGSSTTALGVEAGELGGGDDDDAFGEGGNGFDEDVGGADG